MVNRQMWRQSCVRGLFHLVITNEFPTRCKQLKARPSNHTANGINIAKQLMHCSYFYTYTYYTTQLFKIHTNQKQLISIKILSLFLFQVQSPLQGIVLLPYLERNTIFQDNFSGHHILQASTLLKTCGQFQRFKSISTSNISKSTRGCN